MVIEVFASLENRHADVEQEGERHDHNADLGDRWLLQKLPAHGRQQVAAGHLGQGGVGDGKVTDDGEGAGDQEDPEHRPGQLRAEQLCFCLFGDEVIVAP